MDIDFINPLEDYFADFIQTLSSQHLGSKVVFHDKKQAPDLNQIQIAIIGVPENRGAQNGQPYSDLYAIRENFYKLYPGNWDVSIADLGDIQPGETIEDTYFAVKNAVNILLKKNIIPVILGGSQDLTYAMYRGYDNLDQMVNLVSIDKSFDLAKDEATIPAESFISRMIMEAPNNLFNYSNLGFQTYYNAQEEIDLLENLYFEAYRLGEVADKTHIAEPIFRDADMVSIDMTSVKSSDSGNFSPFTPNGFTGKEICAFSRYAGISDKVTMFGVFNHNSSKQDAVLISQILWYFIEGHQCRSQEYPFGSKENFVKYIVPSEDYELIFYKSPKTERWWLEIPIDYNSNNKIKKITLLPCDKEDYVSAIEGDIPERWWKAQRKTLL